MPSKIIVTGGVGFIGSHICRQLIKDGHSVLCLDDFSGSDERNIVDLMAHSQFFAPTVDCRSAADVEYHFQTFRPEIVYHLAANARESASFFQPISVVSRNVSAYVNVLTNAIKYGARRIITFSSIAAYGHQTPPFTEEMELQPVDVYGLSKKYMEDLTVMLSRVHGIEYVILRPHNVFGEGQSLSDPFRNVIAIWMNKIMRNEPLIIFGDGQQQRAFSYIDNSLPCYIQAMDCPSGEIFNIGNDEAWTINAMAKLVIEAMGVNYETYPIEYLPERHAEVKIAFSEHVKARRVLGLRERVSVPTGVKRMATWAMDRGPQEWLTGDSLEIVNNLTPKNWS